MKRGNIGSSFDDWLREEGIYEEVVTAAIKRVLGRQIERAIKAGDAHQPRCPRSSA